MNDRVIVGTIFDDERLSLAETCRVCRLSRGAVIEIVSEGLVHVEGTRPEDWSFDAGAVRRVRRVVRLRRELDLDTAAVALALDLLDELDHLRRRLARLEYQLKR